MNKQKILTSLKQNFMLKRYKAQEKCEEFIANLCKNKEFNEMYSKYNQLQLQSLKTEFENKKQELLENLGIDIIKEMKGEFSVDEIIATFQNFFYQRMIPTVLSAV